MSQVTGRAWIRVDGQELRTLPGATLDPGGVTRKAVTGGGKVHGFQEEDRAPELDCKIARTKDLDIKWLGGLTNATVMFEEDIGEKHLLREAFTMETKLSQDGSVDLKMSAISCDKV
ncbi:phage tail tube protein [Desulfocurvibacter africanus]|uniref:Tail tube protein, bacteriophage n=1 Tax=Desulfocurvibacter africanus subsp. africanus str. Walvis Bay TaxID=690850 RepID=F3YW21_DESAF|nr:phage tail tube protein [Desulfocurvibacter africanus]EGJ49051.1 Tail tube protein, bacteriophage [Desulfocurvibacter africanus subsp. africanus str. Walvis Bay]